MKPIDYARNWTLGAPHRIVPAVLHIFEECGASFLSCVELTDRVNDLLGTDYTSRMIGRKLAEVGVKSVNVRRGDSRVRGYRDSDVIPVLNALFSEGGSDV